MRVKLGPERLNVKKPQRKRGEDAFEFWHVWKHLIYKLVLSLQKSTMSSESPGVRSRPGGTPCGASKWPNCFSVTWPQLPHRQGNVQREKKPTKWQSSLQTKNGRTGMEVLRCWWVLYLCSDRSCFKLEKLVEIHKNSTDYFCWARQTCGTSARGTYGGCSTEKKSESSKASSICRPESHDFHAFSDLLVLTCLHWVSTPCCHEQPWGWKCFHKQNPNEPNEPMDSNGFYLFLFRFYLGLK